MERSFHLGKINRALRNFETDEKLTQLDKRLIKGFYINDKWELINDSEKESLKFDHKIDAHKVKDLLRRVRFNKGAIAVVEKKQRI